MSENWHVACAEGAFPEEGKLAVTLEGWSVFVLKTDTGYQAVNDRCTHQAARLSPGRVRRGAIMCPLHGARFEVASGKCIGGTYTSLRIFPVRVEGGNIEVDIPAETPGPEERPVEI